MKTRELRVVWTAVAAADLERIAAYLASESPLRAATVIDRIVDRAESLSSLPDRGRTPPELSPPTLEGTTFTGITGDQEPTWWHRDRAPRCPVARGWP